MTEDDTRGDAREAAAAVRDATVHCFACSRVNPQSLGMVLRLDGDVCRGTFTPREEHCGWDGITHGGLLFTALDETMANWLGLQGLHGFTARCETRFREPVPTGTALELEARRVDGRGRLVTLASTARRAADGVVVAECEARFMLRT